jgi:ATPase family associated with various cellular activities (AAA)
MTAEVIARDLGIDLDKIDLSAVISKYRRNKKPCQIFRAEHPSDAVHLFDEVDAVFGKRSEINDAHDRYANIEVSYLLQKMEEYDGTVILPST